MAWEIDIGFVGFAVSVVLAAGTELLNPKIKYEKTISTRTPIITAAIKFFVIEDSITEG